MNITKKTKEKRNNRKISFKKFCGIGIAIYHEKIYEQDDLNMCEYSKWRNCGYNS